VTGADRRDGPPHAATASGRAAAWSAVEPVAWPGVSLPPWAELDGRQLAALAMGPLRASAPPALDGALLSLGAPLRELHASPYGARAALLGWVDGRVFVHRDRRVDVPIPLACGPDEVVALADAEEDAGAALQPTWEAGHLRAPKYFSAQLDAPLALLEPGMRSQWRVHELLHRVVGFAWRPDLTRFEAYVAARLGELLPVVHWYGFDGIGRAACPLHLEAVPRRDACPACEAGLARFDAIAADSPVAAAAHAHASHGLEHWRSELAAIDRELESGRPHPTPRIGLDGASDARGYLSGHWNRLTSWAFGAWVERFASPGADYSTEVTGLRARVAQTLATLLAGTIAADPHDVRRRRARRLAQDLGMRALWLLQWSESARVEAALLPAIDGLAQACRAAADPPATARDRAEAGGPAAEVEPVARSGRADAGDRARAACMALEQAREQLAAALATVASALPRGMTSTVMHQGLVPDPRADPGVHVGWAAAPRGRADAVADADTDDVALLAQLDEGLASALPHVYAALDAAPRAAWVAVAAVDPAFLTVGAPGQRWLAALAPLGERVDPALRAAAELEAWVLDRPASDAEAEAFATVPDEAATAGPAWGRGVLRVNSTARWRAADRAVGERIFGAAADDEQLAGDLEPTPTWLVLTYAGQTRAMVIGQELRARLEAVAHRATDAPWPALDDALWTLLEQAAVVWIPAPR